MQHHHQRARSAWLPAFTLVLCLVAALPATAQEEGERWRGAVDLSAFGGSELEFFVTFVRDDAGTVSATITIPAQGAADVPLSDVVYDGQRIEFTLQTRPNSAVFQADRDGDTATGTLQQGVEMPMQMELLAPDEEAAPDRPQDPRPPFPYAEEEVGYENPDDGAVLAGTLTLPEGDGPHPAAILITGSGSQDRDETIFGHRPFRVLADHLSRRGVAVLRVDDRGIGGSTGPVEGVTSEDFAGDVAAGVRFLAAREDIDAARIGLIGHSEGGLIAPMVATRMPDDVAYLVLLAGTGIPGRELMPLQLAALQRAAGRSEDNVERQMAAERELIARIVDGADEAALREALAALVDVQMEEVPAGRLPEGYREQAIATGLTQVSSAWYRSFLTNDPRRWLRQVECPVLALNGSLDLQVPAEVNLEAIEAALREGGNDAVTTRELPGLNHLFQTATTGHVAEYGQITETFAPAALEVISDWVRQVTGLGDR